MKILVTDGNSRAALAITRSLGKAGHTVIVGSTKLRNLAAASKYCAQRLCYPDPDLYSEAFIKFVLDFVMHEGIDAILPVTDITTMTIGANRDRFPSTCALPFPDIETVRIVADKTAMVALAARLGVDIPLSRTVHSVGDIDPMNPGMRYPLVIKPYRSRVETETGWLYTAVCYAHDPEELGHILMALDQRVYPVMIQEKIVGPGIGVCICAHHGRLTAAFSHRRLREKPPSGGVSVLRESVPLDPLGLEFSERMLSELKWHGVAMVEFKQDLRDERPKLMEINGRFWGSLQLAIDAGIDFPKLLIDSLDGQPTHPLTNYRIGTRTRWLWGDFDALMLRLFKSTEQLDLAPGYPSKGRCIRDFLTYDRNTHLEIERLDDLGPMRFEARDWLTGVFKSLRITR